MEKKPKIVYIPQYRNNMTIQELMIYGTLSTICELVDEPPSSNTFELTCPDRFEEPEFVIPPKRAVPHYREFEISKKKGKRRNY
jgi:hypothetical protein